MKNPWDHDPIVTLKPYFDFRWQRPQSLSPGFIAFLITLALLIGSFFITYTVYSAQTEPRKSVCRDYFHRVVECPK